MLIEVGLVLSPADIYIEVYLDVMIVNCFSGAIWKRECSRSSYEGVGGALSE